MNHDPCNGKKKTDPACLLTQVLQDRVVLLQEDPDISLHGGQRKQALTTCPFSSLTPSKLNSHR